MVLFSLTESLKEISGSEVEGTILPIQQLLSVILDLFGKYDSSDDGSTGVFDYIKRYYTKKYYMLI